MTADSIAPIRAWCRLVEAWLFRCAIESGNPIWLVVPSHRLVSTMGRMFAAGRI